MILRRIEGHSWGEIASEFGLSNHAARVRFSKALQWLRTSVETSRNCSSKSTLQRSKKCHRPRDTKAQRDRKSTRLNSSHTVISYAVFCLKKKKKKKKKNKQKKQTNMKETNKK